MDDQSQCMPRKRGLWKTLGAGLALFSMFFGAGNVIFPLILGQTQGASTPAAVVGFIVTAVLFPLVGLLAILLYKGKLRDLFGRLGKWPSAAFMLVIMIVFGPFGAIPRLVTLMYGTLKGYLFGMPLPLFSVLACALVFVCSVRRRRLIELLGFGLTPFLLLSLGSILVLGFINHPTPAPSSIGPMESFGEGLKTGYMTLDLIAALLFAPLLLGLFKDEKSQGVPMRRFLGASGIAMLLLAIVYSSMCAIASFYAPVLGAGVAPEELLSQLARHILGPFGGLVASVAVGMACLTTAISLVSVSTSYIRQDLARGRMGHSLALLIVLSLSALVASIGFSGILTLLGPVLELCYPALIVLSVLGIGHKLYGFRPVKTPVAIALILSSVALLS